MQTVRVWLSESLGAYDLAMHAADGLAVRKGQLGRPVAEGFYVSLAHTAGIAVAAVTALGPIGVDIERLREVPAQQLADRWFDPAEAQWLATLDSDARSREFLTLWTQKEAVGKALGIGLRGSGTRRIMPPPGSACVSRQECGLGMRICSTQIRDFMLSVACQTPELSVTVHELA